MLRFISEKRKERLWRCLLSCESDSKSASCAAKLLQTGTAWKDFLSATDDNGWTVLQLVALHNYVKTLSVLRQKSEEEAHLLDGYVEACGDEGACGMAPLILSICSGNPNLACSFIESGAPLASMGSKGRNCVYLICRGAMPEAFVRILQKHGLEEMVAMSKAVDTNGYNALHAAVLAGNIEMVELLLGTDDAIARGTLKHVSKDGSNVLHLAARLSKVQKSAEKSKDIIEILFKYIEKSFGEDYESVFKDMMLVHDCFGSTPLHIAAASGNDECTKAMLKECSKIIFLPVAQDNDGYHPTSIVCIEFMRIISELKNELKTREDIESNKEVEATTVIAASSDSLLELYNKKNRLLSVALALFCNGYPVDAVDYLGNSIFHLLAFGEMCSDLKQFIQSTIKVLLETKKNSDLLGPTLELCNDTGWTCFHAAHHKVMQDEEHSEKLSFSSLLFRYTSEDFQRSYDKEKSRVNIPSHIQKSKCGAHRRMPKEERLAILGDNYSLLGVVNYLQALSSTPKIVVVAGAGISTSAGIPDFRSENGLYANSTTSQLFSTEFLHESPKEFYAQVKRLFLPVVDGQYKPTPSHALLRLFYNCGWLTRVYTQNIDMLEAVVFKQENADDENSILDEKVIECHGTMRRFKCCNVHCSVVMSSSSDMNEYVWQPIRRDELPTCPTCGGLLRPDVTFFGEPLPAIFSTSILKDLPSCDLLLVMGSSLLVYPVASLPQMVNEKAVRMLWNREGTGCFQFVKPANIQNDDDRNENIIMQSDTSSYRDVFHKANCDDAAIEFARLMNKADEMENLILKFA